MRGLTVIPDYVAKMLDERMDEIRKAHPDMTDADATDVRAQLVGVIQEYGHLPEFEVVKNESLLGNES